MSIDIRRTTMLVSLNISRWGNRKKDKKATANIAKASKAEADMVNTTKRLIHPALLKSINNTYQEAFLFHNSITLAWNGHGTRIIPATKLLEWIREMKLFKTEFESNCEAFLTKYASKIDEAKQQLGDLFNESDYPTIEVMRTKFAFNTQLMQIPDTQDFRVDLPDEVLDLVKEQASLTMQTSSQVATKDLWNRLDKTLTSLKNVLIDEDKHIFEATISGNINKLLQQLHDLNVEGSTSIRDAYIDIKRDLGAISRDEIKASETYRKDLLTKTDKILSKYLSNS